MIAPQKFLLAFVIFGALNAAVVARATIGSFSIHVIPNNKLNIPKGPSPIAKPVNNDDTRSPAWWDFPSLLTTYMKPKSGSTKIEASTTKMPALTPVRDVTRSKTTQTTTNLDKLITSQPIQPSPKSNVSTTSTTPKATTLESTSSTVQEKVERDTTSQPQATQTKFTTAQKYQSPSYESTVRLSTLSEQRSTTLPKPWRQVVNQPRTERATVAPTMLPRAVTQQPTTTTTREQAKADLQEAAVDRSEINSVAEVSDRDDTKRPQWSLQNEKKRESRRKSARGQSLDNFERKSRKRRRNRKHRHRKNYERRLIKKIQRACVLLDNYKQYKKKNRRRMIEEKDKAVVKFFAFLRKTVRQKEMDGRRLRHHARRKYIVNSLFTLIDHEQDGVIKKHEFESLLVMLGIVKSRPIKPVPPIREAIKPGR